MYLFVARLVVYNKLLHILAANNNKEPAGNLCFFFYNKCEIAVKDKSTISISNVNGGGNYDYWRSDEPIIRDRVVVTFTQK